MEWIGFKQGKPIIFTPHHRVLLFRHKLFFIISRALHCIILFCFSSRFTDPLYVSPLLPPLVASLPYEHCEYFCLPSYTPALFLMTYPLPSCSSRTRVFSSTRFSLLIDLPSDTLRVCSRLSNVYASSLSYQLPFFSVVGQGPCLVLPAGRVWSCRAMACFWCLLYQHLLNRI